jgi:hypothetical protein
MYSSWWCLHILLLKQPLDWDACLQSVMAAHPHLVLTCLLMASTASNRRPRVLLDKSSGSSKVQQAHQHFPAAP